MLAMAAPMVLATLRGTKTQTRRVVGAVPPIGARGIARSKPEQPGSRSEWWWTSGPTLAESGEMYEPMVCPYGEEGWRIAVREAYRSLISYDQHAPRDIVAGAPIYYEADGAAPAEAGRYRHARFMCRWMARLRLEVVRLRVERLQAITEADAVAEGVHADPSLRIEEDGPEVYKAIKHAPGAARTALGLPAPVARYVVLWESLHGPGSWAKNPWVWVLDFKRVTPCP